LLNTVHGDVGTSVCEQFNALPWSLAQYSLQLPAMPALATTSKVWT